MIAVKRALSRETDLRAGVVNNAITRVDGCAGSAVRETDHSQQHHQTQNYDKLSCLHSLGRGENMKNNDLKGKVICRDKYRLYLIY